MKARHVIIVGLLLLTIAAVALRWPRLAKGMATVTRCEVVGNEMIVEYRMTEAFEVALLHETRTRPKQPNGPGIYVNHTTIVRKDQVELIPSRCDLLRGEHYVRLTFRRGPSLIVEGNDHRLEFTPWFTPDATRVKWLPPDEIQIGDNVGGYLVLIASSDEEEEYLTLTAGTDVRKWVK